MGHFVVAVGLPILLIGGLAGLIAWLRKAPSSEMSQPWACGWYLLRAVFVSVLIAWATSQVGQWLWPTGSTN